MHRSTSVVAVVGVLLLCACSGTGPEPSASTPSTTGTRAGVEPNAATVDHTANTKKVCAGINRLLAGGAMDRFATDLGEVIAHQQAKEPAEATTARTAARKELRALAAAIRKQAASADDPALRKAGALAAKRIEKSAAGSTFFVKVKSIGTIEATLRAEMVPWITPVGLFCA